MSDDAETPGPTDAPVRSTASVLAFLAALVILPVVALLIVFGSRSGSGSGSAGAIVDHVDEDRVQAVYLANDEVFFGRVRAADNEFFRLEDAFFLRRVQAAADAAKDEQPQAGLDLVPVSQDVGGSGDLLVNAREVVRVQDLAKDSEIASSIAEALDE